MAITRKEKLKEFWRRFKDGLAEVLMSVAGSVGIIAVISWLQALNEPKLTFGGAFHSYFLGGQLGLAVLAVAGAAFGTLLSQPRGDRLWSVITVLILMVPIVGTAFIVGGNPGFVPGHLTNEILALLWGFYLVVHLLWFIFIVKVPTIPDPQQAGSETNSRVGGIKRRAGERA